MKLKHILSIAGLTALQLNLQAQVVTLPPFFGVQAQNRAAVFITSIDNNPSNSGSVKINVGVRGIGPTTENGIVYNTTGSPTTAAPSTKMNVTSGSGNLTFIAQPTGLVSSTPSVPKIYYVRPYAINTSGATFYGKEYAFSIFNYTSGMQTFTVPAAVDSLTLQAVGGQGGSMSTSYVNPNSPAVGGFGASIKGDFDVTPAEILDILVAGRGGSTICYGTTSNCPTPGGGGGSFIVRRGSGGNIPLLVAGGGAGASWIAVEGTWTPANMWLYPGRPGVTDSVGTDGIYISNPPETYPLHYGGSHGTGGGGRTTGGGGGFRTNGAGSGATAEAYGKKYPGDGGLPNGGYGGGGAGFPVPSSGGGGGGGFSGGAGGFVYQLPGGGGSFNLGNKRDNIVGNSYGQTGDGRVVISWKVP